MSTVPELSLIIDPDDRFVQALRRHLTVRQRGAIVTATSATEGFAWLEQGARPAIVIAELLLPDGSGLDILEAVGGQYPCALLVVYTNHLLRESVARANRLGALYLLKGDDLDPGAVLEVAVERQRGGMRPGGTWSAGTVIERAVRIAARQHALTRREEDILRLAVTDVRRTKLAEALGISENTLKVHIKSILRKMAAERIEDVARHLRAALYQ